jgi:adenosylhomocysteinase
MSAKKSITSDSTPVYVDLISALTRLGANRVADGFFRDEVEASGKYYFSTLEGLDAFLIPIVNLQNNIGWDTIQKAVPGLVDFLTEDLTYILNSNSSSMKQPPDRHGLPYFVRGKGGYATPYWTSECASFTLSVLTNYLNFKQKFGLDLGLNSAKVEKALQSNLLWASSCKRDSGWAWTVDSTAAHPWPTWSLLDTFDEIINLEHSMAKKIEPEATAVIDQIRASFSSNIVGSYGQEWHEEVEANPYSIRHALDLTRLMLALSLYGNRRTVKPLTALLFPWAASCDFQDTNYRYALEIRADFIDDSSLLPSLFRTLVTMAGVMKPKAVSELDDLVGGNHELLLAKIYNSYISKTRISDGAFAGLWGVSRPGHGVKYELYYTERTIEAITDFLIHYTVEPNLPSEALAQVPESLVQEIAEKPAVGVSPSPEEFGISPAYLPVLDLVTTNLKQVHGKLFEDKTFLFLLHFLSDLPVLINKFRELGASYADMFFASKAYRYPEKEQLSKYFLKSGSYVLFPAGTADADFDAAVRKTAAEALAHSEKTGKPILIVEDGGHFISLLTDMEAKDKSKCIGGVEQTSKGHRRVEAIQDRLVFPVVSVAKSRLKQSLEAREVAAILCENMVRILRLYAGDKSLREHTALVLGYGTIGSQVARELRSRGLSVAVYDTNAFQRFEAGHENVYQVLSDVEDLSSFTTIVGTSGERSLPGADAFWTVRQNVIVASGSSEWVEFDLEALRSASLHTEVVDIFTQYTLKKDKKLVRVVLDGEPLNFALSGGISNAIIDPVFAEMLISCVGVATGKYEKPGLFNVEQDVELQVMKYYQKYQKA